MTTPATASSLREATSPEALTRARRRLLTAHPDPTRANTPTPGSLTDEQLRVLAAHDWAPPRIAALDTNTIATAAPITRALLAESVRETLERRLTTERPNGAYDDTRAGHDAFSRGLVEDYDHGNHHLARATIRVADPGLVTCAGLSALDVPDADAPIIDELARASAPNTIASVLADAALLNLDRYATGRGLRYSRVGTALMLAAPTEQRLADAIDTVAAAAINTGARLVDVTTQYIDEEKALASIGIDPWATRSSDEPPAKPTASSTSAVIARASMSKRAASSSTRPARCQPPPCLKTASRASSCPETSACPPARARGRCAVASMSCACRGEAPTKAPSSAPTGERTPVGSSRKWPSSATVSGASAWPPASSARKSVAKSTSSPASPDATKPCTSPTRPRMHAWRRSLAGARTLDEVMGIEGACSNAYFDALSGCVPADVTFDGRSRRPPRDLPNAALSYGYVILLSECVGALHAAGLEPSLGIAHAPADKRPSLALDLMGQFRPFLVDQTVMALLRAQTPARTRRRRGRGRGSVAGQRRQENPRRRVRGRLPAIRHRRPPRILGVVAQAHRPLRADAGARHRRTRLPVERGRLAMIYIIAYDIADNKRRLRVAKTLESWGYRIQESVFQLRLDTATLARVRARLVALISEGDDVIHIYPICSSCADRADILGAAIALDDVGLCRGVW